MFGRVLSKHCTPIGGVGVRSKWNGEFPYREIDFGFVFVRAVRAGEAKLRGRARKRPLLLRRGRSKSPWSGGRCPAVSRRCPAVSRGVPRCPAVSRRCPAVSRDDDDDEMMMR